MTVATKSEDDHPLQAFDEVVKTLLLYINQTPELLSLLYDMDLLPEQCERNSRDFRNMLLLANAWKHRKLQ